MGSGNLLVAIGFLILCLIPYSLAYNLTRRSNGVENPDNKGASWIIAVAFALLPGVGVIDAFCDFDFHFVNIGFIPGFVCAALAGRHLKLQRMRRFLVSVTGVLLHACIYAVFSAPARLG